MMELWISLTAITLAGLFCFGGMWAGAWIVTDTPPAIAAMRRLRIGLMKYSRAEHMRHGQTCMNLTGEKYEF